MRSRRSSGVVVRPLNFTVRKTHPGSSSRNPGPSVWLRSASAATCSIVVQPSSLDASTRVRQAASLQALSPGFQAMPSFIALPLRSTPGRAPTRLLLRQKCDPAPGPQGTQVPSFSAWARLTWRVCRLRLPQQSRTRTVAICGVLSNHRLEQTAGPAEMSKQRTSATSLPRAVLSPLAAQAHR